MAITPPPTPPNTGNPAQLEERADAFFGWFPTFATDFNNDLPLLRGRTYATRGGSANAISLNTGGVALAVGMQVRWRAAAANTGGVTINVDGLGAVEARTITNVALPAGYIRTDADTVATYDGTRWIVERQIERGSNANGTFARFADGTQFCFSPQFTGVDLTTSQGNGFVSTVRTWVYPAEFLSGFPVTATGSGLDVRAWVNINSNVLVTTSLTWIAASFVSITGRDFYLAATGRWY